MANIEKIEHIKSVKKVNVVGKTTLDHYRVTDQNDKTCSVPIDTSNRHYNLVLDWVADGNTIAEAD